MTDDFSKRHGYRTEAPEITVREDAPDDIRAAILLIAKREAMTPHELRAVVCEVLLRRYGVVFRAVLERESLLPPWPSYSEVRRTWV